MIERAYQIEDKWKQEAISEFSEQSFWLTSHGGCGTNLFALCVRPVIFTTSIFCHPPYPIKEWTGKYVYLFGDLINSIVSQENRGIPLLNNNSMMIKYGIESTSYQSLSSRTDWKQKETFSLDKDDPLGIESQFYNFYNSGMQNIIMLKYPFSKRGWDTVNDFLGGILTECPTPHTRKTDISITYLKLGIDTVPKYLKDVLMKYLDFADYIDNLSEVICV